ncbi:hypothetical protein CISG_01852 [Coccidioides immitis RMSCC 3703]|uniref:Major facilitator superfamily (MFS) profile domain-containing protein n=1 Tax=Coccidioides immitis RMSCC 3703 TaxID=454286 RepID=A0A0J8TXW3_COCIT|nr:hypothetical protein CISG_01852 [Coccidioides immitis RMSCC 3703]
MSYTAGSCTELDQLPPALSPAVVQDRTEGGVLVATKNEPHGSQFTAHNRQPLRLGNDNHDPEGRFLLSHPAQKLGRKVSTAGLIAGSAFFQLLVWLVPNIVGDAIALAIVGLLLGSIYPCATAVFATLLPRGIQLSSLGFVSAMGSSGGAVAPFFTGLLAQNLGTVVLHPICIMLYAVMLVSWVFLPKIRKED